MLLTSVLVFLFCSWKAVEPSCSPAEEGRSTTVTCEGSTSGCGNTFPLSWFVGETIDSGTRVGRCSSSTCGGFYLRDGLSSSISPTGSTLTIDSVSRTDPFNMETRWICLPCASGETIACDKLQVYAKPVNPECTVSEVPGSGDVTSVTVSCSTSKVYPRAKCKFYRSKNGVSLEISQTPSYSHPETGETPVYYSSQCSVSVPVQDLGEGTHSFEGEMYPDVTGGESFLTVIKPDKTVTLSLPETSHGCYPDMVDGYFRGKSTRCTCSLLTDGNPRGTAQWYKGDDIQTVGSDGVLVVTYDKDNPEQVFTCEGKSDLGRNPGSTLTAKFALFEPPNSVDVVPSTSTVDLCGSNSNKEVQVTCRVSRENVNPAPTFSFSLDGLVFESPRPGSIDGTNYQRRYSLVRDVGGEYQVFCRVTNPVLDTQQASGTRVTYREPPSNPPQVTVNGQTYQGNSPSNIVTLAEGYTGDATCRVEGGFPAAHIALFQCGQLMASTGNGISATLPFTAGQLTKDMNGIECTCEGQHVSGCYSNKETKFTLNVTYPPQITFTTDPTQTPLSEDDNLQFTCSAQGNPDPTSVTLIRERTSEILKNISGADLTHSIKLTCLDTAEYICSGQNTQGTTTEKISIEVRCPQQLSPLFVPEPIGAVIGKTAEINVEIYGYPQPTMFTLQRINDDSNLINSSARHEVLYTAGDDAPFGSVRVTILNLVESDYTNYTLTIINGVGAAPLTYQFYVYETNATVDGSGSSSNTGGDSGGGMDTVVIGVVVGVAVLLVLFSVIGFLLLRRRCSKDPDEVKIDNPVYASSSDYAGVSANQKKSGKLGFFSRSNGKAAKSEAHPGEGNVQEDDEVVIHNTVYGGCEVPDEVKIDNPVYASSSDYPGNRNSSHKNNFKNYTEVEPTITSASAAPVNMKQMDGDPYEDIGSVQKTNTPTKPAPPTKKKPIVAPKSSSNKAAVSAPGAPPLFEVNHVGPEDETYALVTLTNKTSKPASPQAPEEDDCLPDPSMKPEVPVKQFNELDPHDRGSDVPEQMYGNFPSLPVNGEANSPPYTNASFDHQEGEDSVYANSGVRN